jgi:thiol-disulfide isomerase/thioredoxin
MKLVYFGAEWCPTCKSMYPVVGAEMMRLGITVDMVDKFEYVDVDLQQDRAVYNNICNLPCVQIEDDDGNVIERHVGMMNRSDIKKFCGKVLI